jgi:hypothetical protein
LKANTQHSSLLTNEEKLSVGSGSTVKAKEVEDANEYWHLVDATFDGAPTAHRRFAFKKHWSAPTEAVIADDLRTTAAGLLKEGRSISDISKALGVDRRRIKRWTASTKV